MHDDENEKSPRRWVPRTEAEKFLRHIVISRAGTVRILSLELSKWYCLPAEGVALEIYRLILVS